MIIDRKTLYEQIWTTPMYKLCETYGVSSAGLVKICIRHKIPRPHRAYWPRKLHGRPVRQVPLPPVSDPRLERVQIDGSGEALRRPLPEGGAEILAAERDAARLVVPDILDSPHPLVEKTLKSLQTARPDEKGRLRPKAKGCLDVAVTSGSVDRAMRILDAIIKALEARSFHVRAGVGDPPQTIIEAFGEAVPFKMEEHVRRIELPPPDKDDSLYFRFYGRSKTEYDYIPTRELRLTLVNFPDDTAQKVWRDSEDRRIEDSRNSFVEGVVKAAGAIRQSRIERARWQEIRADGERRAQETEKRRLEEQERVRRLETALAAWGDAERLRAFVAHVRERAERLAIDVSPQSRFGQWLAWAERRAERLDPIERLVRELTREP